MEEIIRLLCEFSANGKIVDKKFLKNLFDNLVNEVGLYGCVLSFSGFFKSLFVSATGLYMPTDDVVLLYYNKLKLFKANPFNKNWQKFEIQLFRNLMVLDSLIHETVHAKQYRICAEGEDDIETKLLLASCSYKTITDYINWEITIIGEKNKKADITKYKEFLSRISVIQKPYIIDPSERIANIGAKLSIATIVNQIDEKMPYLIPSLKGMLYLAYLRGYKFESLDHLGPSFEYLFETDNIRLWQSFDFYDLNREVLIHKVASAYNLEDRLYLGLPVMKEETEDIIKLVHSKFNGVSN